MKRRIENKELTDYIVEAKYDLILYLILLVVFVIGLLLIFIYLWTPYYILTIFPLLHLFRTINRYKTYKNILKINSYLKENKLIDKIGKIDFWNEYNLFLTENYMIVIYNKEIKVFKYSEINEIFKETDLKVRAHNNSDYKELLHIILKNNEEIIVLIYSLALYEPEIKDITDYLLQKNKNIIIGKTIKSKDKRLKNITFKSLNILKHIGIFIGIILLIELAVYLITTIIFGFKPSSYKNTDTIICNLENEEHKFEIIYGHWYKIEGCSSYGSIYCKDIVGDNILGSDVRDVEKKIDNYFSEKKGKCEVTIEGPIDR